LGVDSEGDEQSAGLVVMDPVFVTMVINHSSWPKACSSLLVIVPAVPAPRIKILFIGPRLG
jgi:hypothetical protein